MGLREETGFDDVTFDLISVQYHSLKAGHGYREYVRDARNAGRDDIASFVEQVMAEDSSRAQKCDDFLKDLGGTDNTSPQMQLIRLARHGLLGVAARGEPTEFGRLAGAENGACCLTTFSAPRLAPGNPSKQAGSAHSVWRRRQPAAILNVSTRGLPL